MNLTKQTGFTYLAILFVIAVAGIMLARTGLNWSQVSQREKEHELLFVGNQYRQAIAQYYQRTPGMLKRYPPKLDDLLNDIRYNPPQHYLRKLYRDPVTNSQQWKLIMSPEGGIMGIHSQSDTTPIKTSGFDYANQAFEGVGKYSGWEFVYTPVIVNIHRPTLPR